MSCGTTVDPWLEAAHAPRVVSGEWVRWVKRKGDAVQVIELWERVAHHSLGRASVEQATRTTFLHPAKSCRRGKQRLVK